MSKNAENGLKCWKVAYYFKKFIKLTYLPALSAIFSSFSHFQLSAYHRKKGEGDMRVG
jgi:hypothetical protein